MSRPRRSPRPWRRACASTRWRPGPTLPNPRQDAEAFARYSAAMPLGHGPAPEEVAMPCCFSPAASNITGETIAVDGGQHLGWQAPNGAGTEE